MGHGITRRAVGSRAAGAGAALVRRRMEAAEVQLAGLLAGGRGCRRCQHWPTNALVYPPGEDPGADPDEEWPASLRCDGCGRTPALTIRVEYVDVWPPGGRTDSRIPRRTGGTS